MADTTDTQRAVDLPRIVRLADLPPTEKMGCVLPGQKVLIDPTPTEMEILRIFASFAPQTGLEAVTQSQCRRCNGRGEIVMLGFVVACPECSKQNDQTLMKTESTTPDPKVGSSAIVLPRPMRDAPLDGTHILAHNGDEYFPPVVVHFFGGSWYISKWPDDCDNIYFPRKWWPLPQWQNPKPRHGGEKKL